MMNFVAFEQGKYRSVLESGDQGQLKNLLSAVPSMPEHEVKFLMFSAMYQFIFGLLSLYRRVCFLQALNVS